MILRSLSISTVSKNQTKPVSVTVKSFIKGWCCLAIGSWPSYLCLSRFKCRLMLHSKAWKSIQLYFTAVRLSVTSLTIFVSSSWYISRSISLSTRRRKNRLKLRNGGKKLNRYSLCSIKAGNISKKMPSCLPNRRWQYRIKSILRLWDKHLSRACQILKSTDKLQMLRFKWPKYQWQRPLLLSLLLNKQSWPVLNKRSSERRRLNLKLRRLYP